MNVLLIYAHPEPTSFNGAMRDLAVQVLTEAGHLVEVSDLYAMNFQPVTGLSDFTGERSDPNRLSIAREQTHAMETGTIAADIAAEQAKLARADMLILQFPVWWFGMPAIMKGWADRVFARGFAYTTGRKYDTGLFKGKLAMVAATTGTSADTYVPDGIDGDILSVLWPVHNGLLRYTGFDVLPPMSPICRAALMIRLEKRSWKPIGNVCSRSIKRPACSSTRRTIMAPTNALSRACSRARAFSGMFEAHKSISHRPKKFPNATRSSPSRRPFRRCDRTGGRGSVLHLAPRGCWSARHQDRAARG
ncbi:NAD(P)H-dependent oxidoreductase [Bosea vestrisii]|uniref:NAD(P)H-dependent oxidoreductase n=1 Tax=Bosea vestrisii TaxID=151416 RepID=UPI0024DFA938|nr:NAD(P)H-dependent oxidoreductase [Bosea vestrisii]WID95180.1 NAD(P)H-dependent oxidoreductase [Bosea vestrisii]